MAPFSENPITCRTHSATHCAGTEMPTAGSSRETLGLGRGAERARRRHEPPMGDGAGQHKVRTASRRGFSKPKERLTEVLRTCRKTASHAGADAQLELLESTRMLESALIAGDNTAATFAPLPHVRVDEDKELPRAINLAEGYLVSSSGYLVAGISHRLCSTGATAGRASARRGHSSATGPQIRATGIHPGSRRRGLAAGALPPIEKSPFSAILHSMRRLNQFEWRTVLEPLIAFDSILRKILLASLPRWKTKLVTRITCGLLNWLTTPTPAKIETAQFALNLAREAAAHPRLPIRARASDRAHRLLPVRRRLARAEPAHRIHAPSHRTDAQLSPPMKEDFYILGIFTLSCLLIVAIIAPLVPIMPSGR